jgi:hypothetical protein
MTLVARKQKQQPPTPEIYLSIDIEADGPIPGPYSMLSFGIAALSIDKVLLGTFERNLEPLPGAAQHPRVMEWWRATPERWAAYERTRVDVRPVRESMLECEAWSKSLRAFGKPCAVGAPAAYDYGAWLYWYLCYAVGDIPDLGYSALDLKSFACGRLAGTRYRSLGKSTFPPEWFDEDMPHTHVALDDALEQGTIMVNAIRERDGLPRIEGYTVRSASRTSPPTGG